MNRKLISLAASLIVILSLVSSGQSANAQGYIPTTGDCDCESNHSCCRKIWRCMYGQMVSDGIGGSFRMYGFPTPACCGRNPNGYPVYGMGAACLNGCERCPTGRLHQPKTFGYPSGNSTFYPTPR